MSTRSLGVILLFTLLIMGLNLGCGSEGSRKIRLSDSNPTDSASVTTVPSVLQVAAEDKRSIAILLFENETGDNSLDWLKRGLSDMLVTDLTQSPYLNVVSAQRLQELLVRAGDEGPANLDVSVAVGVARDAEIETVLTGRVFRHNGELVIEVELREVQSGKLVKSESVRGTGMEEIFGMMNELSQRVRTDLRGDLVAAADKEVKLSDLTHSLEAFRCYSEALENREKFLHSEAERCLEDAISHDSTFATAYLRLAETKMQLGKPQEAMAAMAKARTYSARLSAADQLLLKLSEFTALGDFENMLNTLEEFVAYAPYDIEIRMRLAQMYRHLKGSDKAIEEYEAILELDPNRKLAYNELGYIYANRGDIPTALKYIEKYTELAPGEPNPHDSHGEILMMAGMMRESAEKYDKALTIRPDFYVTENVIHVHSELDDFARASFHANENIKNQKSESKLAKAHATKALTLWRFGKIKEAEKAIKTSLKTHGNSVYPLLIAGEMYQASGDTAAAARLFKSYLANQFPKDRSKEWNIYDSVNFCAVSLETDLVPNDDLIKTLETALTLENEPLIDDQIRKFLAIIHLRKGNARAAMDLADTFDPASIKYLVELPNNGWNSSWRFMTEWIAREPVQDKLDYSIYEELYKAAKAAGRKDLEVMARYYYAQYHAKYGDREKLISEFQALGTPLEDQWLVAGPFVNRGGFDSQFLPEYDPDSKEVLWRPADDGAYDGYVNLREVFKRSSWAVGYATINLESPDKRVVQIRLGTDEAGKLWLNDELVWKAYRLDDAPLDRDIVKVVLRPGNNKLLLKVSNRIRGWGFYFRVTDEEGNGIPELRFHAVGAGVEDDIAFK